ncbi:MAG: phytoene/squalene synthetase [Micavibrio aeruginosavorus]|uniref:Phytoene/squalene synthetase n=1 Tax=Micavibrio aeruginosavorus TaxID=349221 RepID=A0A2W5A3D5_9BACT|nr:MAG: phytoene/squalene synthetase [Micavibrio aeruginosavorus]
MTASFIVDELKAVDYDRYLLGFFVPRAVREGVWALYLLNHEIARTRSMVTDTNLGLIRLQWWRDEIARLYDGRGCGQIPVLSTLAPYVERYGLKQDYFDQIIYAREFDLEDRPPSNEEGLCNYARFLGEPLNRLALQMIGGNVDDGEVIDISRNFELMKLIRGVPFMLSEGRFYLPQNWVDSKGLSVDKLVNNNEKSAIVDMVERASSLVVPYRKPENRFLCVQQKMTDIWLKKLRKNGFDVFNSHNHVNPKFFGLRLLFSPRG